MGSKDVIPMKERTSKTVVMGMLFAEAITLKGTFLIGLPERRLDLKWVNRRYKSCRFYRKEGIEVYRLSRLSHAQD